MSGIRLTILDDGLFVRTYAGELRPVAATFHRFVEAVARAGPFERVRYVVPVRQLRIWEVEPALDPVDESVVEVVPTTFFSGLADYLLRAGWLLTRNWRPIDRAIADADLLWLRLPASNAPLALAAARRHRVPYFGWLAGSAAAVAGAQRRPWPMKLLARGVGAGYDAVSDLARRSGPTVTLDAELFASVVTATEVDATRAGLEAIRSRVADEETARHEQPPWRVVWSGRMAGEKGLAELIDAVALLLERGLELTLVVIGDGPARPEYERALARLPAGRVEDYRYVGDRPSYMKLLRRADLFVHPSRAEGVPKVLVEAMAAGLPVVAADAGSIRALLGEGERGVVVPAGDPLALARAVDRLLADAGRRAELRQRGLAWAAQHTAEAQAQRLVSWLRQRFPQLDWQ
ncbi:MAG: glycosyltransferase [Chloroflexota bacterium]|nr:glycosyltransferase [Chloroflexota bacterium]